MTRAIRMRATFLAALAVCASATSAIDDPREGWDGVSQRTLERVVERFVRAETVRVEAVHTTRLPKQGDREPANVWHDTLKLHKPDRLRLERSGGSVDLLAVCDGETVTGYSSAGNRYRTSPRPEDVFSLLETSTTMVGWGSGNRQSPRFTIPILAPDVIEKYADHAESVRYLRTEMYDGVKCKVFDVTIGTGTMTEAREGRRVRGEEFPGEMEGESVTVRVWVQTEPFFVPRRAEWDLSEIQRAWYELVLEDAAVDESVHAHTVRYDGWKFDEPIDADVFAFAPPEGAEEWVQRWPEDLLGEPAPDFTLELLGGGTVSLSAHRGRDIVILDFWHTGCGPCIRAMPYLLAIARDYEDRNVAFYPINTGDQPERLERFIDERGWDAPIPLGRGTGVAREYNVAGIPQVVLIDKDGTVQAVHVGFGDKKEGLLRRQLDALLAGESLTPVTDSDEADAPVRRRRGG